MANTSTARTLLWPADGNILLRVVFLYVGQGTSTLAIVADGGDYRVLLIDINRDDERNGIDVAALVDDLLNGSDLLAFVNSHPHNDHLRGVLELADKVGIREVWHSGHRPSKKHGEPYDNLQTVIRKIKHAGGKEVVLRRADKPQNLGDAQCHVLAPSASLTEEVNEEHADERYARIHEQCAVLKLGRAPDWVMLPGDADRSAFEQHIVPHFGSALGATVLAAAHHGSCSYFRSNQEEEPYFAALEMTNPAYVVVSAPRQRESPHSLPDSEAMKYYERKVGSDKVAHTGEDRHCFMFDIYRDGGHSQLFDRGGQLVNAYGLGRPEQRRPTPIQNKREYATAHA